MNAFKFLTDEAEERIHEGSLDLLERVGVKVGESLIRRLLLRGGCSDVGDEFVLMPRELVMEVMSSAQPTITLHGTDPGRSLSLDGSVPRLLNAGTVSVVADLDTGDARDATLKDAVEMVRLLDALPHLPCVVPSLFPADMHPSKARLAGRAALLRYTGKPASLGAVSDAEEITLSLELSKVASAPGRPVGTVMISPVSPLTFPSDICDAIAIAAGSGLPTIGLPCPVRALGAPLYLAGVLVGQNAENLASAVMARLVNPEVPLMHASRIFTAYMRTGAVVGPDPDMGLAAAAMAQMGRRYGLPSNVYVLHTAALTTDAQAGFDKATNALKAMLAGADLIVGLGLMGSALMASFTQAVIDDEIFSMLSHHIGGFAVEPRTIDLDGFRQAACEGESFMAQETTLDALAEGEVWTGRVSNADYWEEWVRGGRQTIGDRARQYVKDVLAADPVEYLSEDRVAAMEEIISRG